MIVVTSSTGDESSLGCIWDLNVYYSVGASNGTGTDSCETCAAVDDYGVTALVSCVSDWMSGGVRDSAPILGGTGFIYDDTIVDVAVDVPGMFTETNEDVCCASAECRVVCGAETMENCSCTVCTFAGVMSTENVVLVVFGPLTGGIYATVGAFEAPCSTAEVSALCSNFGWFLASYITEADCFELEAVDGS